MIGLNRLRSEDVEIPISFTISIFTLALWLTIQIGVKTTGLDLPGVYDIRPIIYWALATDLISRISGSQMISRIAPSLMYGILIFAIISCFGVEASYVLQCADFPLRDDLFQSMDSAIGIDWFSFVRWVERHPWIAELLRHCYNSLVLQLLIPVIVFSVQGRTQDLRIFIGAVAIGLAIVLAISTVLPALSHMAAVDKLAFHNIQFSGASPVDQLLILRNEIHPRVIGGNGLLSFPSFHAVVGALCPLALRKSKLFPLLACVSIGLFFGSVTEGAHYVADVIAGVAVAILAYLMSSALHAFELKGRQSIHANAIDRIRMSKPARPSVAGTLQ